MLQSLPIAYTHPPTTTEVLPFLLRLPVTLPIDSVSLQL